MKQTPAARLIMARVLLAKLMAEDGDPAAIAFWKEAVAECEAEMENEPMEKPE